ncbi:MAG TPA: membrane protein insertase YidC [Fibrobacteraceae bacterium]|nr:membrane protein insertase YidC [Fibrobacteraceae bacterium]
MNRNTIIGSVLIAAIMIWWMTTMPKPQPAPQKVEKAIASEVSQDVKNESKNSLEIPSLKSNTDSTSSKAPAFLSSNDTLAKDSLASDSLIELPPPVLEKSIVVETDLFILKLSNRGAKVSSVIIKTLTDNEGNFPELIEDTSAGALDLKLDKTNLSDALFAVSPETPSKIVVNQDTTIQFVFSDPNRNKVIRSYTFSKTGSAVRQSNRFEGFQPNDYEILWNGGMRETELFPKGKNIGANYYFSEIIYNNTYSVEREVIQEKKKFNDEDGKIIWAGLRRKYVAMSIQFDEPTDAVVQGEPLKGSKEKNNPGTYQLSVSDYLKGADSLSFNFMILPLEWTIIKSLDQDYEKVIVSGWQWIGADVWFVALCGLLLSLLKIFYSFIPNYGIAIILLTILVRIATTPLTIKQLRSTKEMGKIKPELDAINVKYRAEPQKKQAAIMELYAKHNINPMASCTGGCFPMLLQFPIFIGLFIILARAIELRGMPFIGWISDLSRSDVIWNGITIPYIMPEGLSILPLIMVVTTYFQTKQSMSAMTDPAQRKMMIWMMPGMMFVFSAVMPSGLVLYWIISNLWGIGQYAIIHREKAVASPTNAKIQDAEIIKPKKKKKK